MCTWSNTCFFIFWSLSHKTVVLNNLDCMRIPNYLYTMFDIFLFKCWLTAIFFFTVWQNRDDKGHTQSWLCNQVFNELFLWRESETKIWNVRIHAYTSFNEKTAGKKNNLCQGRALNNHALRFKNHFVNENYYKYYIKTIW